MGGRGSDYDETGQQVGLYGYSRPGKKNPQSMGKLWNGIAREVVFCLHWGNEAGDAGRLYIMNVKGYFGGDVREAWNLLAKKITRYFFCRRFFGPWEKNCPEDGICGVSI